MARTRANIKNIRMASILVMVIIAAVLFTCSAIYVVSRNGLRVDKAGSIDLDIFHSGIHIMDIDMSGKTREQAEALVNSAIQEKIAEIDAKVVNSDLTYKLSTEQLGITHDAQNIIETALAYNSKASLSQEGSTPPRIDFDITFSYDKGLIHNAMQEFRSDIDTPAKNAAVSVLATRDEPRELTGSEIMFTDGETGGEFDVQATTEILVSQLENENYLPVEAILNESPPEYTKADLERIYGAIGTLETRYADSIPNRRYNIWKMGDSINAVQIEPGQTWSINEQAGPRTRETGYKEAPGITNGELVSQPGGGICQVSSTLYNAVILAELEVVEKQNHSWRQKYVDGGLDATISSNGPDFRFKNNKELPIFILVDCDGESRKISVSIFGPKRDDGLAIKFSSEKIN